MPVPCNACTGAVIITSTMAVSWSAALADPPPAFFSDQTIAAGLIAEHAAAGLPSIHDRVHGGAAAGDFDADGWMDLYFAGGGNGDKLFLNNGDGTFRDATDEAGLASASHAAAAGDYDNDGDLDVIITTDFDHQIVLRNNGLGQMFPYVDAAMFQSGADTSSSMGLAMGDYDLDGDLDVFVSAYENNVEDYEPNRLYRNEGGFFTDVTDMLIAGTPNYERLAGFHPRWVDMNGDRYPELLAISDFGTTIYFRNNGDGTFTDTTEISIPLAQSEDSYFMGNAVADFDGDLDLDLYVTNIEQLAGGLGNLLFLNDGNHNYTEVSNEAGVNQGGWGWGASAIDVNHDGLVDIVATNGWPNFLYEDDPSLLWLNNGDGTFTEAAEASGLVHTGEGRGVVNFDYDNDGDQDIVICDNRGPIHLFRNDLIVNGVTPPGAHWLRVLLDTENRPGLAPNGYGTRVYVTAGGVTQLASVDSETTHVAQSELSAHFGLGAATIVEQLRVEWADGRVDILPNLGPDQTITVIAPPLPDCPGDVDGNDTIDFADALLVLSDWGPCATPVCPPDINGDQEVGLIDLLSVLSAWGACE